MASADGMKLPNPNNTVAVRAINNWDGEHDVYLTLAYIDDGEIWRNHESASPLIEYQGDQVLEWWGLTPTTGNQLEAN